MDRRRFLQWAGFAASTSALASCAGGERAKVLSGLVLDVMMPATSETLAASRQLRLSMAKLVGAPSPQSLQTAREEWKKTILSFKRARCFPELSSTEPSEMEQLTSWPTRPAAIEAVLAGSKPMEGNFLDELGVDAKGLFGLEYLLFAPDASESAQVERFAGLNGARRRRFAAAICKDLVARSEAQASALGDGKGPAESFAQGGQGSIERLAGHMVRTIDTLASKRMGALLAAKEKTASAPEVEGGPSGSSHEIALAQIHGTERVYRGGAGGGVGDLVRQRSASTDERLRAAFSSAAAAVQKLAGPLEQVAQNDRAALEAARTATQALAAALRDEMAGALGVTLKNS